MPSTIPISGQTKILCVIGDPIEHTMSPAMHNAAIKALGLDLTYIAFHVKPEFLKQAIDGFKATGILGINVTIPHKVNVIQHLNKIDPVAKAIGAVNTIKNVEGMLHGRNTDADGAMQALKDGGAIIKGAQVILLGAGGGARAVGFALAREGARVTILVREADVAAGAGLTREIKAFFPSCTIQSELLDTSAMESIVPSANVVINATPVGMYPDVKVSLLDVPSFRNGMSVLDLVYNPHETRFLQNALSAGCKIVHGIDMLVNQGAMAFEWWTGTKPPVDVIKSAAMAILKGK